MDLGQETEQRQRQAWDLEHWKPCLVHLQASVSCETAWAP